MIVNGERHELDPRAERGTSFGPIPGDDHDFHAGSFTLWVIVNVRRPEEVGMADTKNGPELHPATVDLARGANFGSITTVLPSGNLQTQLIWVHTDGERLVVNTEVHRQKYQNVQQDPRVTLTIRDEQNPYRYAEV
jgi:hypothetical protein